jgi:PAS domain S-box-containing protein
MAYVPQFLSRWLSPDLPLAQRIGTSAFLLGMLAMLVTGGLSLVVTLIEIPRDREAAHRQAATVFAVQFQDNISAHEQLVQAISESSLVWTAITDSFGREAYLKPYLAEQQRLLNGHHLLLLDYRARMLSGEKSPDVKFDTVSSIVWETLKQKRPVSQLAGERMSILLTAYPVLYPYTQEPIGVLLSASNLDHLFDPLAGQLNPGHSLRLLSGDRVLLQSPQAIQEIYQPVRQAVVLPEDMRNISLNVEYSTTTNTLLQTITLQLLGYFLLALLFGAALWRLARREANRLTARLNGLAAACSSIVPGHPATLPVDNTQDEIGQLNRALRAALDAHARLDGELEDRITRQTRALTDSTANFRSFFDSIDYFAFILDMAGNVLLVNQTVVSRLGYCQAELVGSSVLLVHPEDRRAEAQQVVGEMLAGRRDACPVPLLKKDGGTIPVETRIVRGLWDGKPALFGISKDITERLQAEAALRASEHALRRAQQLANVGSWRLMEGGQLQWDDNTYRIFGIPPGTPISYERFAACIDPEDRELVDIAWHNALQGAPYDVSHRIRIGHRTRWVRERAELELSADGTLRAGIGTVQDITAQVETEEALRQASAAADAANHAKSLFLATMSHEIRTPLNAVIGLSHLAHDHAHDDQLRDYLQKIESAGKGLLGIINDILDFSKIEAGRMQVEHVPYDPREVIGDARRQLEFGATEKGLALHVEIDNALPQRLLGDPLRLRQILLNLISNAIKFTSHGSVDLRASVRDGHFCCAVVDSGIGINAEQMSRLFAPFSQADSSTTRNYGGSGLGLTISRRLAGLMGGTLKAASEASKGSAFTLCLPLEEATGAVPPAPTFTATPEKEESLAGARVLLVEDNAVNQHIGRTLLGKLGLEVTVAANGQEALDLVEQQSFNLVLMDIHMPVMDGIEATHHLRERYSATELPIVAMTADAFAEDRERCIAAGMNDHIAKPLDVRVFPTLIRRWLRR